MSETPAETRRPTKLLLAAAFAIVVALGALSFWYWTMRTCCARVPDSGPLVAVPSGQEIHYVETVSTAPGQQGLTYRFRFIAPAISRNGGTMDAESSTDDMLALCNTFAVPRLPDMGPRPDQVIISLADRETKFGEPSPEATQFFESFSIENEKCVWQLF